MGYTYDYSRLRVDGVQSIVISNISPDPLSTEYVRLIQIYTDPATNTNRRPIVEVAVYGGDQQVADQTALEITIPGGVEF
jgi:hypothetical protein